MPFKKTLLIGWDGADWKVARPLMQQGKLPQLQNIVRNGSYGNLASMPPYLSPMLWNSIGTGKDPHKHGIAGFSEVCPETQKVRPIGSYSRKCKAIWNLLSEQSMKAHVVGWFASHPAENINGVCISDAFTRPLTSQVIEEDSISPNSMASSFQECKVHPGEIETGILEYLVPNLKRVPQRDLNRMYKLRKHLAELYTVHNSSIEILKKDQDFDFLGIYFHFLDWISHDFMEFHPPYRDHIDKELFDLYQGVVERSYQLQDLLLSDLLTYTGSNLTVMLVSDHGFQSDHQRPIVTPNVTAGIAAWHRPMGIVAMVGPGIKSNYEIKGARLADITPTLLHHFGLAIGSDMDGKVLDQLFSGKHGIQTIPSWENTTTHYQAKPIYRDPEDALLNQFESLGYVESDSLDGPAATQQTRANNAWNMGVALRSIGYEEEALPYLEESYFFAPEKPHHANQLALCQLSLQLFDGAEESIQTILDYGDETPRAHLVMANIECARGNYEKAWNHLDQSEELEDNRATLMIRRGEVLYNLNQAGEALAAFEKAKQFTPDDHRPFLGCAKVHLQHKQLERARDNAQKVIDLQYDCVEAHLILSEISEAHEHWENSLEHAKTALSINPKNILVQHRVNTIQHWRNSSELNDYLKLFKQLVEHKKEQQLNKKSQLDKDSLTRFTQWEGEREAYRAHQSQIDSIHTKEVITPGSSGKSFTLVSGLPRSGTSMMMKILNQAGCSLMTDSIRTPDQSNPNGYFEWEPIKSLAANPEVIEQSEGKVTKVISLLLPYLPIEHQYNIIFMCRDTQEISKSQASMIDSQSPQASGKTLTSQELTKHKETILAILHCAPNVRLVEIDYNGLLSEEPGRQLKQLIEILPMTEQVLMQAAQAVIDPALYNQKNSL
ncbi:alkaline phosphatase family protein [Rubritalea marina]|uniref:alkaline phosphatase family protein n=1 Tax=Rubritalea marina TaxID=361055 RepID=UPI000365C01D|nr:alkaline phosphatase family protein [Rubritalea marina]